MNPATLSFSDQPQPKDGEIITSESCCVGVMFKMPSFAINVEKWASFVASLLLLVEKISTLMTVSCNEVQTGDKRVSRSGQWKFWSLGSRRDGDRVVDGVVAAGSSSEAKVSDVEAMATIELTMYRDKGCWENHFRHQQPDRMVGRVYHVHYGTTPLHDSVTRRHRESRVVGLAVSKMQPHNQVRERTCRG